jgi:hypothetical protein
LDEFRGLKSRSLKALTRKILEAYRRGRSKLRVGRVCRHTKSVFRVSVKEEFGDVENGWLGALKRMDFEE